MCGRLTTTTIGRLAIIAIATLCAFWFANNAAAQQTTVIYSVSPSGAGVVNAAGSLIVNTPGTPGDFVITVSAASVTIDSGGAILGTALVGSFITTMNIVTPASCTIRSGCAALDITAYGGGLLGFENIDVDKLRRFVASGASPDELPGGIIQAGLLYRVIKGSFNRRPDDITTRLSILVAGGANPNNTGSNSAFPLYVAASEAADRNDITEILLAIPGINPRQIHFGNNWTALDRVVDNYETNTNSNHRDAMIVRARLLRAENVGCSNLDPDRRTHFLCSTSPPDIDISGNARTFIARSNSQTTSIFIGALSPVQGITYSALPANVVSVSGQTLQFIGRAAGNAILATVFGVAGTPPQAVTGTLALTINALASCSVRTGCAAFGFGSAADTNARVAILTAMSEATMSMFVASGANLDESTSPGDLTNLRLAFHLANAGQTALLSVLVHGGANLNYVSANTSPANSMDTILFPLARASQNLGLRTLLSVGISDSLPESRRLNLEYRLPNNFTILGDLSSLIAANGKNSAAGEAAALIIAAGADCSTFRFDTFIRNMYTNECAAAG